MVKVANFILAILFFDQSFFIYSCVLISLYPTTTYILRAIPLSRNKLPAISQNLVKRFKLLITTELVVFAVIPFLATLMARGIGLVQT